MGIPQYPLAVHYKEAIMEIVTKNIRHWAYTKSKETDFKSWYKESIILYIVLLIATLKAFPAPNGELTLSPSLFCI